MDTAKHNAEHSNTADPSLTQPTHDRPDWCGSNQDSVENQHHPELDAPKTAAAKLPVSAS
jgi:hypothetical protein